MLTIRIAFLIMLHDNPTQANYLINQLLAYEHRVIFVHIDAKSIDIIPELHQDSRIHILEHHINGEWGDYTQMQMIDALLKAASSYDKFDYYSLHSGCDMAIKPISELATYLHNSRRYAYYSCAKLPAKDWGHGGGIERLALSYPKFFRKKYKLNHPMRYLRALYQIMFEKRILKGKKLPEQYQFYGGSEWFTISNACLKDYFEFREKHPDYDELFINALAGDEIYYVTIFEMMRNGREVESANNLTYIDWSIREENIYAGSPATCSMKYIKEIESSGSFFARKFDWKHDREIVDYYMKKTMKGKRN